jgi:hypothetical protein
VRVLFFINHDGFIRNFEGFLHSLARRGDTVSLAVATRREALMSSVRSLEELTETEPAVTAVRVPKERGPAADRLSDLAAARSYLRYLEPEYADAPKLRERAANYVPPELLELVRRRGESAPARRKLARKLLAQIEDLPTSPSMDRFIEDHEPDVVLLTSLVWLRDAVQAAALKSARRAGLPTALLVHSWDNLSNKGLIHTVPDRIAVWNEAQRQEVVELHGVPAERVVVTGAHSYDHWFDWRPATSRDEFCAGVGLDPARPFVLYVCSSTFIAPDEAPFVKRWITALRGSSDERVRRLGVVVRPHPQNVEAWAGLGPAELGGAAVFPSPSAERAGEKSRADYYDSIHHAAAVMGVNTTAQIESAIQERPVLTWLVPEFRETQEGTLHFGHIAGDDGLLLVARSFEEHERQLVEALATGGRERSRAFVRSFIRPFGLDVAGTPRLVEAVAALAAEGPVDRRRSKAERASTKRS